MSQLKKQKPEAAGSSGAVQALRMENDAPVVGPDAPTANSRMVKPDIGMRTGVGQPPVKRVIQDFPFPRGASIDLVNDYAPFPGEKLGPYSAGSPALFRLRRDR